jgi:hypothetical protein
VTDLEAIREKYRKRKLDRLVYDALVDMRKVLGRPPTEQEIKDCRDAAIVAEALKASA